MAGRLYPSLEAVSTPDGSSVLHILVVGFHHQKGCVLEYIYPPLTPSGKDCSLTSQLPYQWRHLPHLALPDGCHNYEEDASFFVLRPHEGIGSAQAVYGVACCRQVDSKDVEPSTDITRSTVQKSVCVLSKYPLFGSIEAKLSQVMQAYFEVKDFSDVTILHDTLANIKSSLQSPKIPLDSLQVGLSQQAVVRKFGHRLLQVFKALLLQKKVLVCGVPTKAVCRTVLGISSLFPKSLEQLLNPNKTSVDDCGFPLHVFPSPFSIQPYLCLQQMDVLADDNSCTLAGVANPLFQKMHSKFCDVYVDTEDSVLHVNNPDLKSTLYLSAADLRFCEYISSSVRDATVSTTNWHGSNGWVQSQFKLYLLTLLATSLSNQAASVEEFGRKFMDEWFKSPVYINWKLSHKKYTGMAKVEPAHICQGDLTFHDLKLRISAQATEYGVSDHSKEVVGQVLWQTQQAIGNVGSAVGGAWSAASSAVSSWWSGGGDDEI
jgi:hypothetical protein